MIVSSSQHNDVRITMGQLDSVRAPISHRDNRTELATRTSYSGGGAGIVPRSAPRHHLPPHTRPPSPSQPIILLARLDPSQAKLCVLRPTFNPFWLLCWLTLFKVNPIWLFCARTCWIQYFGKIESQIFKIDMLDKFAFQLKLNFENLKLSF